MSLEEALATAKVLELTKQLRHELLRIIPDTGSQKTKPEQILLNALISYENKRKQ